MPLRYGWSSSYRGRGSASRGRGGSSMARVGRGGRGGAGFTRLSDRARLGNRSTRVRAPPMPAPVINLIMDYAGQPRSSGFTRLRNTPRIPIVRNAELARTFRYTNPSGYRGNIWRSPNRNWASQYRNFSYMSPTPTRRYLQRRHVPSTPAATPAATAAARSVDPMSPPRVIRQPNILLNAPDSGATQPLTVNSVVENMMGDRQEVYLSRVRPVEESEPAAKRRKFDDDDNFGHDL